MITLQALFSPELSNPIQVICQLVKSVSHNCDFYGRLFPFLSLKMWKTLIRNIEFLHSQRFPSLPIWQFYLLDLRKSFLTGVRIGDKTRDFTGFPISPWSFLTRSFSLEEEDRLTSPTYPAFLGGIFAGTFVHPVITRALFPQFSMRGFVPYLWIGGTHQ